jgi:hypothetical protein
MKSLNEEITLTEESTETNDRPTVADSISRQFIVDAQRLHFYFRAGSTKRAHSNGIKAQR